MTEETKEGLRTRTPVRRPAPPDHPIHPLLAGRWSPRAMDPRPFERARLVHALEAARWAPSCFNDQPWRFLVATTAEPEAMAHFRSLLGPGNSWALAAPVLVLVVARTFFERSGKPNRHGIYDAGAAAVQLVLQLGEEGLVGHQMAGFDHERARIELGLPEGHEAMAMMAIGTPGVISDLPEKYREREVAPRVRRPLTEIVFAGRFGQPFDSG